MKADELKTVGKELWGWGWIQRMSEAIGVHRQTIADYARGVNTIPGPVEVAVRELHRRFRETGQVPSPLKAETE